MKKIRGIQDMSRQQLLDGLGAGARFVRFEYCYSVLILTTKAPTDIYYVPPGRSTIRYHLPYTILSAVAGWWGVPWGFIYTPMVLYRNLRGGTDVTERLLRDWLHADPDRPPAS